VQTNLEQFSTPTVWSQGVFEASSVVLDRLIKSLDTFNFGVFVFSPDDIVFMRGQECTVRRDNVVFELGLFVGRLGRERNFVVVPRGQSDLKLPTDLLGLTTISYDETRPAPQYQAALGPACRSIQLAIRSVTNADRSGGDARHKEADIIYSSRIAPQIGDFVAHGERFYGEGREKPKGAGSFRIRNGILVIERSNAAGRFLAELRRYRIGDQGRDYIPRNDLTAGQRILRLTCEVKSTKGARKVIWVLKQNEPRRAPLSVLRDHQ
jgi:Predicted nucleotide-binding protein containing TIR-like domain